MFRKYMLQDSGVSEPNPPFHSNYRGQVIEENPQAEGGSIYGERVTTDVEGMIGYVK